MASYISSFEELTFTIGRAIDAEANFSYQLNNIETGSIKSIQSCFARASTIAKTLANIPTMLAKSMVDIDEITSEADIEKIATSLEEQLREEGSPKFPNQINIDRPNLAKAIKRLTDASAHLVENESIKIKSPYSNVVPLNTKTRFHGDPVDFFTDFHKTAVTKETLLIKRPVFFGKSAWDFRSVERKKSFSAPILHTEWLDRYQKRELGHLDPGDALIALVSYEVTKQKGSDQILMSNHKILHIDRMVKSDEIQSSLTSEDLEDEQ